MQQRDIYVDDKKFLKALKLKDWHKNIQWGLLI